MGVLRDLLGLGVRSGGVDVVNLTAIMRANTPTLELPKQPGRTVPFQLHEFSRYDKYWPAWYWSNNTTGEHTGTPFNGRRPAGGLSDG